MGEGQGAKQQKWQALPLSLSDDRTLTSPTAPASHRWKEAGLLEALEEWSCRGVKKKIKIPNPRRRTEDGGRDSEGGKRKNEIVE